MIKRQRRIRIAAAVMIFALVIGVMAPFASAAASLLNVSRERFFSDTLYFSNGRGELLENGSVRLSFDGGEPSVAMDIVGEISPRANSIRVVIDNVSLCDTMTAECILKSKETGEIRTDTAHIEIAKGKGAREYIIPIEDVGEMTSLRLSFGGAVHGDITLVSIGFVSYYDDEREYCGELIKGEYDQNTKTATIQGSVSWDCVSGNPDAKIVVYKLTQDQTLESVEGIHSYIAWSNVSLNFNIKIDVKKNIDAYSQYAVAVLTDDGRVLPVAPEFYLSVNKISEPVTKTDGFKGMETLMYGGVIDGNSEIAYVDVHMGRLFGDEENGFQHMVDGAEYYVDSDYVAELDATVNAYRISGVDVYLRLLIDSECAGELFGGEADGSGCRAVDIFDEKSLARFTVYTEYVIARYAGVGAGNVKGIAYGRSLDAFAENNSWGETISLNEYSRRLAKLCAILRGALDKYGNGLELIIPFSDAKFGVDMLIPADIDSGAYPIDLLASSLLEYASDYKVDLRDTYFMLEGDCAPVGKTSADIYGALTTCKAFEAMTASLSERFAGLPAQFIYCWYAGSDSIFYNYVYNYVSATSVPGVRSMIVSLADLSANERNAVKEIATVYKFIDTDRSEQMIAEAIKRLGYGSWDEIVEGYVREDLIKQDYAKIELRSSIPNAIIGSYKMWDFEKGANALGWQNLSCEKISVGAVEGSNERALTLLMSKERSESIGSAYGSAEYSHESLMKVTGISGISFEVFVPRSEQEKIYEVVITIKSDDSTTEFSGVVFSGSDATLYADIQKIDAVKSIEISTRELSATDGDDYKIYVRNISIHSNEYGDAALEKLVVSGSITEGGGRSDVETEELAEAVVVAIIAVSLLLIWGVWLFYKASKAI